MNQKFKRGNKVKVLFGHPIWSGGKVSDMVPEEVGTECIIIGSYADQYGGNDRDSYTVIFCDTGLETSWKQESQLEFVEEGGEHLIEQAKLKRDEIKQRNTDLKWIISNWKEKKGGFSSDTILFLFDKIGYKSAFFKNGEFYTLSSEWTNLYPIFDTIFTVPEIVMLHTDIPEVQLFCKEILDTMCLSQ